ncbi:Scr1 family TA system antitoxin-like transcriptional regulator [Streptomyces goshikiensis]|uniref:Scr1 family TA system antitoxin-like transcriptional regulator n=1 Tax=Streptomyces goshikiensis TaxID=1942 RepID=UPI003675E137
MDGQRFGPRCPASTERLRPDIHAATLHYRSAPHPSVMREQLRRLLDMAELRNITMALLTVTMTSRTRRTRSSSCSGRSGLATFPGGA